MASPVAGVHCVTGGRPGPVGPGRRQPGVRPRQRAPGRAGPGPRAPGVGGGDPGCSAPLSSGPPGCCRRNGLEPTFASSTTPVGPDRCGASSPPAVAVGVTMPFIACVAVFTDARSAAWLQGFPGLVLEPDEGRQVLTAADPREAGIRGGGRAGPSDAGHPRRRRREPLRFRHGRVRRRRASRRSWPRWQPACGRAPDRSVAPRRDQRPVATTPSARRPRSCSWSARHEHRAAAPAWARSTSSSTRVRGRAPALVGLSLALARVQHPEARGRERLGQPRRRAERVRTPHVQVRRAIREDEVGDRDPAGGAQGRGAAPRRAVGGPPPTRPPRAGRPQLRARADRDLLHPGARRTRRPGHSMAAPATLAGRRLDGDEAGSG